MPEKRDGEGLAEEAATHSGLDCVVVTVARRRHQTKGPSNVDRSLGSLDLWHHMQLRPFCYDVTIQSVGSVYAYECRCTSV